MNRTSKADDMSDARPPLRENATRDLARFGALLRFEQIPAQAVARMKSSVLDSLGCCLLGATLPWTRKVAELAESEAAKPVASMIGMGRKTSAALAALVNGTAGHAFELDDIHKESILHAGTLTLPVGLALFEEQGKGSGKDLITAMVAGYEIATRVGNGATMDLFLRGFHPQGTTGAFASAATAAHILGLDASRFQHALGIAGSLGSGLMAAQEGAMVKRLHCGHACQVGIYSARLAQKDFTGIQDIVEAGYGGFVSSHSDKPNPGRLTDGLGTTWETLNVGYKPHASVTSIHSALDSLREIMRDNGLGADDIDAIEIGLSRMTYVHCAWEYKAQGVTAAQMNLFYGMAVIAVDGVAFKEQYDEKRLSEPRILGLIRRQRAYVDKEIEEMGPAFRHACRVKLKVKDGRVFEKLALHRRGSPENPLKPGEIVEKFHAMVASCMKRPDAERIVELVDRLDTLPDVCALIAAVACADSTPLELNIHPETL
jgi:2-methylcitrate dehydratase PrpD